MKKTTIAIMVVLLVAGSANSAPIYFFGSFHMADHPEKYFDLSCHNDIGSDRFSIDLNRKLLFSHSLSKYAHRVIVSNINLTGNTLWNESNNIDLSTGKWGEKFINVVYGKCSKRLPFTGAKLESEYDVDTMEQALTPH